MTDSKRVPDWYMSRAPFMQPILDKMHQQQKGWKELSISAPVEGQKK